MSARDAPTSRTNVLARRAAIAVVAAFAAYALLACTARWTWWGELAASLRWYAGLAGVVLAALAFAVRARVASAAAAALSIAMLAGDLALYVPRGERANGPRTEVLAANLLWGNASAAPYLEGLRGERPAVLALVEVSRETRAALESIRDVYPYQVAWPAELSEWNEGTWGLAIASHAPLASASARTIVEGAFPVLEARVRVAGGELLLRVAHAPDPSTAERWRLRDAFLERLAALDWPRDSFLVGDLNVTSCSPRFDALLEGARLTDGRRGFGRQASWRAFPAWSFLALDLDHTLHGAEVEIAERELVALPGSDHDAVRVRVRVARPRE